MRHTPRVLLVVVALAWPGGVTAATRSRAHAPAAGAARAPLARAGDEARSRTLDDIHIEGEVPVPQVLFVTARDQRHFMTFQHHRYLRSSAQLGEATLLPRWIVVTPSPSVPGKEIQR